MEFKKRETIPVFSSFKECITHLMTNYLKLDKKYIDMWTTPENLRKFQIAFTHSSYDDDKEDKDKINSKEINYEFYEIVGDACLNKNIVYYIQERFPQFHNPQGVEFISKLKLNMVSKSTYRIIAEPLGIYPWIRASKSQKDTNRNKLLEDVLEAFVGCFELIVNEKYFQLGCPLVYTMTKTIFDKMNISITKEAITSAVSKLHELFHILGKEKLKYVETKIPIGEVKGTKEDKYQHKIDVVITWECQHPKIYGTFTAFNKKQAKESASEYALVALKREGITREYKEKC